MIHPMTSIADDGEACQIFWLGGRKGPNLAIARRYKRCEIKVLYVPYFFDRQTPLVLTKKC